MAASFTGKATECISLIKSKQRMLCDSWLTRVGHLRPGMAKGLPLDQANKKAAEMDSHIKSLLR